MSFRDQITQPVVQRQSIWSQIFVRVTSTVIALLLCAAIAALLGIDL